MEGPTLHTSIACGPHEENWSGFWCGMTLVPGCSYIVLLKLNSPNKYSCADSCGFNHEACNKLSVKFDWSVSWSHSDSGKPGSQDSRTVFKCLLNILMSCSAIFFHIHVLWYQLVFYFIILYWCFQFFWCLIINDISIGLNFSIIEHRVYFFLCFGYLSRMYCFNGSARIIFLSKLYPAKIHWLPRLKVYGKHHVRSVYAL